MSRSANKGRLWLSLAAVGIALPGRARRGALRGAGALTVTSLIVNAVVKPAFRRKRPDIELTPLVRRLSRQPRTTSFPSGHAASAAAFATGLGVEHRAAGLAVAPLAVTVGYSRVHVGVHHVSDVLVGAALGAGVALMTQWWWPVLRDRPPSTARTTAPALAGGRGLVTVVNPNAGYGEDDGSWIIERLPGSEIIELTPDLDIETELDRRGGSIQALGAAGGDGTVAAIAAAAAGRGLPVAVFPTGTLNHFARDLGLESGDDTVRAVGVGSAVAVELGTVGGIPFLNTASIGAYPEMVRKRDELAPRVGKWLAMAVAAADVLRRQRPARLLIDGVSTDVWALFVGNGRYIRRGPFPVRRLRLDDGLLDVQYLRVGALSRTRAVLAALVGMTRHNGVYRALLTPSLLIESRDEAIEIARDGESGEQATAFRFSKLPGHLTIYHPGQ